MNAKQEAAAAKTAAAIAETVAPIVAAIEAGIANPADWRAPWHDADPALMHPYCPATDRFYTAGNRLALAFFNMQTGTPHHWGTFNQWQDLKAQVRKGERAQVRILRPATVKRTDEKTGDEVTRIIGWNAYPVFHAGQVDGYTMPAVVAAPAAPIAERADIDHAFTWAAGVGARVEESATAGASYSPTLDRVLMPDRDRLTSAHGAWSTLAHELTHWTGHDSRLDRNLKGRFGDDAYAAEELIAELGAAFTLAEIGRSSQPRPDHAQYLASWLRVLRAEPSRLWTAASHAEKAAAYITEHATIAATPLGVAV